MTAKDCETSEESSGTAARTLTVSVDASGCLPEDITVECRDTTLIIETWRRDRWDRRGYLLVKTRRGYLMPPYADIAGGYYVLSEDGILTVRVPVKTGVTPCQGRRFFPQRQRDGKGALLVEDDTAIIRPSIMHKGVKDVKGVLSLGRKDAPRSTATGRTDTNCNRAQNGHKRRIGSSKTVRVSKSLPEHRDYDLLGISTKAVTTSKSLPTHHDGHCSRAMGHNVDTLRSPELNNRYLEDQKGVPIVPAPRRLQRKRRQLNVSARRRNYVPTFDQHDGRLSKTTAVPAAHLESFPDEHAGQRHNDCDDTMALPIPSPLQHRGCQSNDAHGIEESRSPRNVASKRQLEAAGGSQRVVQTQGLTGGNLALLYDVVDSDADAAAGNRHRSTERQNFCCCIL